MAELNDSAVVRNLGSNKTHVAHVRGARTAWFIRPYWSPNELDQTVMACGVTFRRPIDVVIMRTGTKVRCRACVHATGVTEQSPSVHEKLGDPQ